MATSHQTTEASAARGKEAIMATTTTSDFGLRSEWVEAHRGQPERILSALGHPGYGRRFARQALALIEQGHGSHEAVYGLLARWGR